MSTSKKTEAKSQPKPRKAQATEARPKTFHLTVVSEEERELYRVPVYGYLLP